MTTANGAAVPGNGAAGTIPKSKAATALPAATNARRPSRAMATARDGPGSAGRATTRSVVTSSSATSFVPVASSATRAWAGAAPSSATRTAMAERAAHGKRFALGGPCPTARGAAAQRCSPSSLRWWRSRAGSSSPAAIAARTAQPGSVSWRQSENRQPAASSSTSAKAAATPAGSALMRGRRRPGVSIEQAGAVRAARTARGAWSCGARGRRCARISRGGLVARRRAAR